MEPLEVVVNEHPAEAADRWRARVRATYEEVHAPLWRAVVAWSGSVEVADEAVAEAFAQLLRRGNEVRDPAAWVWRAAFRLAAGDLQRRRRVAGWTVDVERASAMVGRTERLPDDALDLVAALASLSDQQRRCVALVDVAGHTAPSAAALLGTSAATVRVQLLRARRRLRTLLSDPSDTSGSTTTSPSGSGPTNVGSGSGPTAGGPTAAGPSAADPMTPPGSSAATDVPEPIDPEVER